NYSGTGSFIKNGSAYVTVFFDWEEEKEYLVETDVYSGASVLLTTNDRTWTNFNARGIGKIEEIKYTAVDGETEETGLVYYYCQYEAKYEIGISGDIHLGFYSMRENKWLFFREYSLTGTAAEIPDILFYRNNFFIVSGNNIRCLTLDGNEELSYFDRKIVYCAEDAEAGCIVLAFEDGTAGIFDLSSKSFKGAGSSTYVMTSHLIRSSSGSGIANGPFCAISQEDPKTAIVFQYYEMDKTVLEQPLPYADEWEEEFDEYYKDDRGIYAMPEGEGFVQVSYYYYFELDNIGDDHSYVIIYNSEGEAIQTFQGYYFGNDAHFTTDGKKLYWDEAFVSLDEEKIYRIRADVEHDTSYPEHDGTWTKLHSSSMEGEVLSAYWKNGSLYTFISGEEQPVRQPPDTCVYDGLSDLSYYGSRNLVAGNNGLIILLRCDSSVNSDSGFDEYRTDKYQIYSVKNDQWYEIENASAVHGFPYVAAAEKKPWFVSLDDEGELLLYDVYSESLISRWQTNVVRKALSEIQFIMNDEYLLIQSDNGGTQIRIIRCSDGSTVFSSTEGNIEENHYSNYFPQYDSRNDRLYLVDEYGYGVGICIDTKSWTSLFRIENLRCVLNNNTFIIKSPDDEKIVQCKGYDLETLIRKAVQHPK
ncbi:MAG: hypothetical protein Q4D81_08855, partial [Eubacteriales bacterium]|nr:hypothetical protein [Eubacteriales bacterium]